MNNEDGDALSKAQEERIREIVARMNVFSQHQKVMAETVRSKEITVKQKNKK